MDSRQDFKVRIDARFKATFEARLGLRLVRTKVGIKAKKV